MMARAQASWVRASDGRQVADQPPRRTYRRLPSGRARRREAGPAPRRTPRAGRQHAVLAPLDDHVRRPQRPDRARRADEVRLPAQLPRLLVVDDHGVDAPEDGLQLGRRPLDPVVHRIKGHERRVADLLQHLELQRWVDVGEEDDGARPEAVRNPGLERLEHVEVGVDRLARVEVGAVLPAPAERLAGHALQALEIDRAPLEDPRAPPASKSSPTTATRRTSVKKDAATLKNVAAPPTMRDTSPAGVRTESSATEPTVRIGRAAEPPTLMRGTSRRSAPAPAAPARRPPRDG